MPRVSQKAKEEGGVATRAPRKTVTRAPRKTVSKKTIETDVSTVRRKAPTRITEEEVKVSKPKREKSLYVSGALFGLGLLAAALIGYSDKGQINPSVVIAERNARLSAGVADAAGEQGQAASQVIPVQNNSNLPNGGLVPSKSRPETPPPEVEDIATSTASSSDDVASTTEDGTEEESDTEGVLEGDIVSASESESPATEEMDSEVTAE